VKATPRAAAFVRLRRLSIAAGIGLLGTAAFSAVVRIPPLVRPAAAAGEVAVERRVDPVFDSAALVAWEQFERLWVPATGLARATPDYDKLTPWDMGSVIAALFSAKRLGLLPDSTYRARLSRTLETLATIALYDGVAFNKLYDARSGRMLGMGARPSSRGHAYSATDLGRLLLWLRIIERNEPAFAALAGAVASRVDFGRVVADGYLHGEERSPRRRSGIRRFQEGRIGYEQYAARGFAVWGADVGRASDLTANAAPLIMDGIELLRDRRGLDRLTSEPFILLGLEAGWTPAESALSVAVLRVQELRYLRTNVVTVVSEDAVGVPPHYFYYSCVWCSGRAWVVETAVPGRPLRSPRWVSTKAAFAWHALLPGEYTRRAVDRVAAARTAQGWSAGVMERSGTPTRSYDINTAAVILEAAAYHRLGRPLLRVNGGAR